MNDARQIVSKATRFHSLLMVARMAVGVGCGILSLLVFDSSKAFLFGLIPVPTFDRILLGSLVMALGGLGLCCVSRGKIARVLGMALVSLTAGMYLFESFLLLSGRFPQIDADWSEYNSILLASASSGQEMAVSFAPQHFIGGHEAVLDLSDGTKVLPLGGQAGVKTIMCKEGRRPFVVYQADEYGFNNPVGLWNGPVEIVFAGDSFTYGACVSPNDHFVSQVRQRYPGTLSLGYGGNGPLLELATVREYAKNLKPRFVFWMYDANNDLYEWVSDANIPTFPIKWTGNLDRELTHPVLRRYLDDPVFSQALLAKRELVNFAIRRAVQGYVRDQLRRPMQYGGFLALSRTRYLLRTRFDSAVQLFEVSSVAAAGPLQEIGRTSPSETSRQILGTFRRVLRLAAWEVSGWGAFGVRVHSLHPGDLCSWKERNAQAVGGFHGYGDED